MEKYEKDMIGRVKVDFDDENIWLIREDGS
jgi:hypothetical protein